MTMNFDLDTLMMRSLDGEALSVDERAALDAHFVAHPAERALLARMAAIEPKLAILPSATAPATLGPRIMAIVRVEGAARNRAARRASAGSFIAAAGLAVFAALAMIISATVLAVMIPAQAWLSLLSASTAVLDSLLELPRAVLALAFAFGEGVLSAPAGLAALGMVAALVGVWMVTMIRLFSPRPRMARR